MTLSVGLREHRLRSRGPSGPSRSSRVFLWALVTVVWAMAESLQAQEGCEFVAPGNNPTVFGTIPRVGRVTYVTDPHFLCAGGVEIFADSAVAYSERGFSHLIGSVRYLEGDRTLTADEARYFTNEGRLQASGHVSVQDPEQGSAIRNGDLVYLLKTDFRAQDEMTVVTGADGIRPVAILTPPGDEGSSEGDAPVPPYTVVGDRIVLAGTGSFLANGSVEIVRDSLFAYADSAEYQQEDGALLLDGRARIVSASYELIGSTITMAAPDSGQSQVEARREARLVGDDLVLTAARIVLFLQDDALERLVATPLRVDQGSGSEPGDAGSVEAPDETSAHDPRPQATVQDFVLTADSLEVDAPSQVVERVFAAGSARSVSTSRDSLNVDLLPEVARADWLEGDTVLILFSPSEMEPNGVDSPRLEVDQIVAIGRARSLSRLPPSDSTSRPGTDPPAVHYVVGDRITIQMEGREVDKMTVVGKTHGVHLEPLASRRRPTVDSLGAAVDTLDLAVDTLDVAVDTLGAAATPALGSAVDSAVDLHAPIRPRWPSGPVRPINQAAAPTLTFAPAVRDRARMEIP